MHVVIFRARIRTLDADYGPTAARLRDLALREMGCLAFHACTEGEWEIAVSYWPDAASIARWRSHPEHRAAQERGMRDWYAEHHVDVAEVVRSYGHPA